jgi:hypothetical protein
MDSRFEFSEPVSWRNGIKQKLFGSEYTVLKPTKPIEEKPKQIEFEMMSNNPLLFGNMCRFHVTGKFETRATAADAWGSVPPEHFSKVMLMPNWWENLIQSIDLYHANGVLKCHDESNFIPAQLNTYLYSVADKNVKKFLCPDEQSPGYCVPTLLNKWNVNSQEWKKYADLVFTTNNVKFSWVPLHTFPFFQSPNFLLDTSSLKALPALRNLGRLTFRLTLKDDFNCIWRKIATNTAEYRFKFVDISLSLEEARISPTYDRMLFPLTGNKSKINYPGVVKIMSAESISNQVFFHNIKFNLVPFPEGIFIFALPKKVIGSSWSFSEQDATKPIFLKHNIESVSLEFNGETLNLKDPHFGDITNDLIELKNFVDHIAFPPFGMHVDQDQILRKDLANSFADTNFPLIYLNLCTENKNRIIAHQNNGSGINKDADLNICLKFGTEGAAADSTYIIYLFYTDYNMTLDLRTRRFVPYYNLK